MARTNILIVEDEALVAADLEDRLTRLGYTISGVADNSDDAIRVARERPVDLALMDIKLIGERDGIDTARQMRDDLGVAVVYLTSHTDPRTLDRAGVTAPYGYIVKPYDERALQATIEMAFHRRAADERSRQISEWLTSVMLNVGEPILAYNCEGRVVFMNPAAEELIGWTLAEVNGRPLVEVLWLLHERTGELIQNPLWPAHPNTANKGPWEETILLTRSGARLSVEYVATPMCDAAGEAFGTVMALSDVTLRKSNESVWIALNQRLQEANHRLQTINDGLTHPSRPSPERRLTP